MKGLEVLHQKLGMNIQNTTEMVKFGFFILNLFQCFLFKCEPAFKKFSWTKVNEYFQFSKDECLAFGGGGNFGLWIDNEFSFGSSHSCTTFNNEQLSSDEDFMIYAVELYGFEIIKENSTFENTLISKNISKEETRQDLIFEKRDL
jgi:hypothetical protein